MPRSHKEVEILITKLEQSLRDAMLWSSSTPSVKALQSKVPFSFDLMPFEHWLQFVFIPKMSELLSSKSELPDNLKLLPMAEQSFGVAEGNSEVIDLIKQIDLAFAV
jgi:uncharacterized protein YqcC (DUF446 family)